MKWNVICNAEDRYPCFRAFLQSKSCYSFKHRITSLELLRTLMLCLVQVSNCKATMLKSLFLRERKLLNAILRLKLKYMKCFLSMKLNVICNAEANARPQMLKRFFLSERKLNAILRVKLKYMKDVSFSWNEMLFAMQKTDIHVLELFCRASSVRASMNRITSLELLRTLMLR